MAGVAPLASLGLSPNAVAGKYVVGLDNRSKQQVAKEDAKEVAAVVASGQSLSVLPPILQHGLLGGSVVAALASLSEEGDADTVKRKKKKKEGGLSSVGVTSPTQTLE